MVRVEVRGAVVVAPEVAVPEVVVTEVAPVGFRGETGEVTFQCRRHHQKVRFLRPCRNWRACGSIL